jgi:hypothetical protein
MEFKPGHVFKAENLNRNDEIDDNSLSTKTDFENIKCLGKGSYGIVYQVKQLSSNRK